MSTSNVFVESRRPAVSVYAVAVRSLVRNIFAAQEQEVTNYTGTHSLGASMLLEMVQEIIREEVRERPDQEVFLTVTTNVQLRGLVNYWLHNTYKYSNGGDIFWMAHCLFLSLYVRNNMCSFGDFHPFGEVWKELDELAREFGPITFKLDEEGYIYVT